MTQDLRLKIHNLIPVPNVEHQSPNMKAVLAVRVAAGVPVLVNFLAALPFGADIDIVSNG